MLLAATFLFTVFSGACGASQTLDQLYFFVPSDLSIFNILQDHVSMGAGHRRMRHLLDWHLDVL